MTITNNSFQSETPHFFKVILKDDIRKGTLRIPKKFVQNHGSGLSDVVRLEVPSGRVWEVDLQRDDGDLFLQNGWADFVESCCISFGYFVVFRHEGYSRFHVVVFDVTACEVKYPVHPCATAKKPCSRNTRQCSLPELGRTGKREVRIVDLSDDEVLDSTRKIGGKKPLLHLPRPSKRSRDASPGADCSAPKLHFRNSMDGRGMAVKRALPAASSGAFLRASSYKCQKPSTIVIVRSLNLYLPLNFWKTCFPDGISNIKVCVSDSKTWMIHASNSKYPEFCRGWRKFLADNNLTEGDVCLFEVMPSAEPEFRVVIFRKGDVARMPNDMVDLEGNDEVGRKNPLSRAVTGETSATDPLMNVGSSHLFSHRKLQCQCHSVASHKVRKTSEEKVRVEEMNEDGGSDVLTDSNRKNPPSYCQFSTSNMGVQTEDPTDNENLDAHMSSARERPPLFCPRSSKRSRTISKGIDAPSTLILSSQLQKPTERHHLEKSAGTLQRASSFLSENPSCIVVIRSIKHLYFPINFLTTCFPGGRKTFGDIKVCVPGKGTWILGINKERYPRFSKGWNEFVVDNELRIGDVCLFGLMRSADVEFQFIKFREEDEIAAHIRALLCRASQGSSKILLSGNANEIQTLLQMPRSMFTKMT